MLNFPSFFKTQVSGYEIEHSLRFDESSYLTRTSGSSGAQTFTLSFWSKKTGVANYNYPVFVGGNTTNNYGYINYNNGQYLTFGHRTGGSGDFNSIPNASYRDTGAWYHHVVVLDFSNATQGDRYRLYTNGVEVDSFSAQTLPSNTATTTQFFRSGENIRIGCNSYNTSNFFSGYFAEFHCVYGSALDPDQFGEYDNNGVWRPKRYTGSHGAEGFYLKFDPSATNGIGHDHSGNGNNWTASGFTTSGTGTDVMSDTPTNNWCTFNPLLNPAGSVTYGEGNLRFSMSGTADKFILGTIAVSSGKWYWELVPTGITASSSVGIGICKATKAVSGPWVSNGGPETIYFSTGSGWNVYGTNVGGGTGTIASNNVLGVALDMDGNTLSIYKNNTLLASRSGSIDATTPHTLFFNTYNNGSAGTLNAGQRAFAYTPPTGYKALNTANLPAPTVKDGSTAMDVTLYTGITQSPRTITGLSFEPDFVWVKNRTNSSGHYLWDSVRGTDANLRSDGTFTEAAASGAANGIISTNASNGFVVKNGSSSGSNVGSSNSQAYAAWAWDAGGTGSSNTDGSITSTVSANPSAGFSVVSYAGNNSASATVGHGLGVSPGLVIVKDRSTSDYVWMVKFAALGGNILQLNGDGVANAPSTYSVGTIGTLNSTTFGFTTNNTLQAVNGTGQNYIAYCFSEVEGYSKFGNYAGNSSTDGVFVYTGFRPAFVMCKNTQGGSWFMHDTTRMPYNPAPNELLANSTLAEGSSYPLDILSNGFKWRSASGEVNTGPLYIFAAFAEHPFGGSGVSPATAR